jgi:enoyl-CoA hydratase/carnithine racemase
MQGIEIQERAAALWVTLHRPPLDVLDVATIRALEAAVAPLSARLDPCAVVVRSGQPEIDLACFPPVAAYLSAILPTDDAAEGVAAFLEKRPPSWRNE